MNPEKMIIPSWIKTEFCSWKWKYSVGGNTSLHLAYYSCRDHSPLRPLWMDIELRSHPILLNFPYELIMRLILKHCYGISFYKLLYMHWLSKSIWWPEESWACDGDNPGQGLRSTNVLHFSKPELRAGTGLRQVWSQFSVW